MTFSRCWAAMSAWAGSARASPCSCIWGTSSRASRQLRGPAPATRSPGPWGGAWSTSRRACRGRCGSGSGARPSRAHSSPARTRPWPHSTAAGPRKLGTRCRPRCSPAGPWRKAWRETRCWRSCAPSSRARSAIPYASARGPSKYAWPGRHPTTWGVPSARPSPRRALISASARCHSWRLRPMRRRAWGASATGPRPAQRRGRRGTCASLNLWARSSARRCATTSRSSTCSSAPTSGARSPTALRCGRRRAGTPRRPAADRAPTSRPPCSPPPTGRRRIASGMTTLSSQSRSRSSGSLPMAACLTRNWPTWPSWRATRLLCPRARRCVPATLHCCATDPAHSAPVLPPVVRAGGALPRRRA